MKITTALYNKMYRVEIQAAAAICEVYLVFSVVCCQVSVSAYNVQSYLAMLHGASGGLRQLLTPGFRTCHLRRSALVCGDDSAYAPIPAAVLVFMISAHPNLSADSKKLNYFLIAGKPTVSGIFSL